MGYLRYKDYIGSVEYDEERICLCGKVQGMPKVNITTTMTRITTSGIRWNCKSLWSNADTVFWIND